MWNLSASNISFTDFKLLGFHSLGEWRPFLLTAFFLMFVLSTTANSTLIGLIASQRSLYSPMYVLMGSLAVVDLILPFLFIPNMFLNLFLDWNGISLIACLVQMFFIYFVGSFQSTLVLWMSVDRYFAICKPLSYHENTTILNFLKIVILPVIRNLFLMVAMVSLAGKLSFCSSNVIDHCFCEHMALVQLACGDTSINNAVGLSSVFLIPMTDFILVAFSYVVIFSSLFKSGKAQMKAMNTCVTHIIVMSCDLLFALIAFLSYRVKNNLSTNSRVFFSAMYILFPSCFNPVVYGVRTKEIRQKFVRVLRRGKVFSS